MKFTKSDIWHVSNIIEKNGSDLMGLEGKLLELAIQSPDYKMIQPANIKTFNDIKEYLRIKHTKLFKALM